MRPTRDLRDLRKAGLGRLARLHIYVNFVLAPKTHVNAAAVESAMAFVVIELDNLWSNIARCLFLSTAFGARDGSGNRLELAKVNKAESINEALTHAIRGCRGGGYRPRGAGQWSWHDEPSWWKTKNLLAALNEIGASNYQQVSAAMSIAPITFAHLRPFRNFYAHRSQRTRAEVVRCLRRLQFPTNHTATRALTSPLVQKGVVRPQPVILDWLDDVRNTIVFLV